MALKDTIIVLLNEWARMGLSFPQTFDELICGALCRFKSTMVSSIENEGVISDADIYFERARSLWVDHNGNPYQEKIPDLLNINKYNEQCSARAV